MVCRACANYLFNFWGSVLTTDSAGFTIDTYAGMIVRVDAPGYTDIIVGDRIMAHGVLDIGPTPFTLTCDPAHLVEY